MHMSYRPAWQVKFIGNGEITRKLKMHLNFGLLSIESY